MDRVGMQTPIKIQTWLDYTFSTWSPQPIKKTPQAINEYMQAENHCDLWDSQPLNGENFPFNDLP